MEPGRVQMLLREAIAGIKAGNKSWARDLLGRILQADPRNEEAWLWMSSLLETTSEKRFCLEKVLAINPGNVQAQAGLRWLEQQSSTPKIKAIQKPKRTLCPMCGEPNEPQAFQCANCGQDLFVVCPQCGERVDIDRPACATCGLEIGDSGNGAGYFFHLGELYLEHGQPKRAIDTWDKTLFLNPDYPRVAEVAAQAFFSMGQRDLTIQSIERAIEEATDEKHKRELRLRMANYYLDLGNRDAAGQVYKELLQEDTAGRLSWTQLYVAVGRFFHQDGDIDEARTYYEMALTLDENLHETHYALAEILLQKGHELRALGEFRLLQGVGGEVAAKAGTQVEALRPPVADDFRNRWQETARGMARYVLAGLVLLALAVGREWTRLTPAKLLGLLACILGGYLLTAATATPRNLPTPAMFGNLAEKSMFRRMRLQHKKATTAASKPSAIGKFIAWQRASLQRITANLRVAQMRAAQALHRGVEWMARTWEQGKRGRVGQALAGLRHSKFVSTLAKMPLALTIARFWRRIWPREALGRLGQGLRGQSKRLVEQAGKVEVTEMVIYRWIAAVLGLALLILAGRLLLIS